MKQNILYVGLDVDDSQFHGSAFNKNTGKVAMSIGKTNAILLHKRAFLLW
jgi:hypothetical protein